MLFKIRTFNDYLSFDMDVKPWTQISHLKKKINKIRPTFYIDTIKLILFGEELKNHRKISEIDGIYYNIYLAIVPKLCPKHPSNMQALLQTSHLNQSF